MVEHIKIEKGEIVVDGDQLTILDNAKQRNRWLLVSAISWTVFGIISVLRYLNEKDEFLLWTGLAIGIGHFGVAIYYIFFNSNASVIKRSEIKSVKKKNGLSNEFIAIKLKNGRVRKITQLQGNSDELLKVLT